jgi:hypothetical protein
MILSEDSTEVRMEALQVRYSNIRVAGFSAPGGEVVAGGEGVGVVGSEDAESVG